MNHTAIPAAAIEGDWKLLVHNSLAFEPSTPVSEIHHGMGHLKGSDGYAAIVESGKPIGLISRTAIGFLLGSKYGHCLYGAKAVRDHMLAEFLCISEDMTWQNVLALALSRPDPFFYHDVVLVDRAGYYCGLISVHSLVHLQATLLSQMNERLAHAQVVAAN